MEEVAASLRQRIASTVPLLRAMSETEAAVYKLVPERWAKKEIVGHLIDSARNNHQRLVRARIY